MGIAIVTVAATLARAALRCATMPPTVIAICTCVGVLSA